MQKWLNSVLDTLARSNSADEPVKASMKAIFDVYKLGKNEREKARSLIFDWVRQKETLCGQIEAYLDKRGGMRVPERFVFLAQLALINPESKELILKTPIADFLEFANLGTQKPDNIFPDWFKKKIDNNSELLESFKQRAPKVLAYDKRFVSLEDIDKLELKFEKSEIYEDALILKEDLGSFKNLDKKLNNNIWLMDDGSQWVASLLEAKEEDLILDMCAGGGGKTRFLAQINAQIVAADVNMSRLSETQKRNSREDNKRIKYVLSDGLSPVFEPESFDKILLDAPCSGTGTLRRRPEILLDLTEEDVTRYSSLQKDLLKNALKLLKPGGRLAYATCSVLKEENEEVIKNICELKEFENIKIISQKTLLPHETNTDGFFAAVLESA